MIQMDLEDNQFKIICNYILNICRSKDTVKLCSNPFYSSHFLLI